MNVHHYRTPVSFHLFLFYSTASSYRSDEEILGFKVSALLVFHKGLRADFGLSHAADTIVHWIPRRAYLLFCLAVCLLAASVEHTVLLWVCVCVCVGYWVCTCVLVLVSVCSIVRGSVHLLSIWCDILTNLPPNTVCFAHWDARGAADGLWYEMGLMHLWM